LKTLQRRRGDLFADKKHEEKFLKCPRYKASEKLIVFQIARQRQVGTPGTNNSSSERETKRYEPFSKG
jgi:hypothetical protein